MHICSLIQKKMLAQILNCRKERESFIIKGPRLFSFVCDLNF